MDVFDLFAKISIDDSEFQKGMENAAKSSKNVKAAVQALQSPFDKLEKAVSAAAHPVETAKTAFQGLKEKTEEIRHPIETLKNKWKESSASIENQRNRLESLTNRYESAKKTVDDLSKEYNKSVKETGKYSDESRKLADQLTNAEGSAAEAKETMEKYAASVSKTGKESDDAAGKTSNLSHSIGKILSGSAKAGAEALKGIGIALGAASTAVGVLTKISVDAYGDYEQLIGGVETLYGTEIKTIEEYAASVGKSVDEVGDQYESLMNRQGDVLKNAANAYKTAGLSANEYMETVTGFAASLTSSLGENAWQAASYADMIVTDMADNANKMGSSMESIQNAYAGFSKQNFTMLDNLKLGYGGTKEEMERLMRDAEKFAGFVEGSLNISSFADVAQAINIVQNELGIAGTTAKEASSTIQGSLAAMKSAWGNLVTGIADENADLGLLIANVVDSVSTAGKNLIPRVKQILKGIGSAVKQLAPIIQKELPGIVNELLPELLNSGSELLTAILDGIIAALPALSEGAQQLLTTLVEFISENFPVLLDAAMELISTFGSFIIENLPMLIEAALSIILQLADGISNNLPELIPTIVDVILQIVDTLIENVDQLIDAAIEIIMALADGLIEALPILIEKAPEIVGKLVNALVENAPKLLSSAWELVKKLSTGIINNLPEIGRAAGKIIQKIVDGAKDLGWKILNVGKNIVTGVWNGISEKAEWLWSKVSGFFSGIVDGIKGILGIRSPSRVFAGIGKYMAEGLGIGWDNEYDRIRKSIDNDLNFDGASLNVESKIEKSIVSHGQGNSLASGNVTYLQPVININGAQYKDEERLVQRMSQELAALTQRRSAIYANGL